jgi:hypothetical protein
MKSDRFRLILLSVILCGLIQLSCSSEEDKPNNENIQSIDNIIDLPTPAIEEPHYFMEYDLYKNRQYEERQTVFHENRWIKFNFNGNIDWNGERILIVHFEAISDVDTLEADFDAGSLMKYKYHDLTNYDDYSKAEYGGIIGEMLIEKPGEYLFKISIILGDHIIALNKAKVMLYQVSEED